MGLLYSNDLPGKQAKTKDRMVVMMNQGSHNLKGLYQSLFNEIWLNPDGLTAQQVLDAFGINAADLFDLATALGTFLVSIDPSYVPPTPGALNPPRTFTINVDRTVTVTS